MANALWITFIGMGMVFIVILLLWGLMALLVRLTTAKEHGQVVVSDNQVEPIQPVIQDGLIESKRRAAAAAVAAVLAFSKTIDAISTLQTPRPPSSISVWQVVQRVNQISRRSNISRRKAIK